MSPNPIVEFYDACRGASLAQREKGLWGRLYDAIDDNFDVTHVRGLKAEAGWKLKFGNLLEFSPSVGAGMFHRVYEDGSQELVFGYHAKTEQALLFLIDGEIGIGHEWGSGHTDGGDLHGIDRSLNVWDGTFLPGIFDWVEFGPKTPVGDVKFKIHPWGMMKGVWKAFDNEDDPND